MTEEQTVHIADDDEDDRMLIKEALEEVNPNVTVVEASDGRELIENVNNDDDNSNSVVLLDMNMPRMNGIETIKELKSTPELADLPAIMLSTSSNPDLKRKALEAGADDFIVKPNNFKALLDIARNILVRFFRHR